jgi:nucleotide-binding universal stress UspA family protein
MISTLVVPLDGSDTAERALDCAQLVAAKLTDCDVRLLGVDVDDGERVRPYLEEVATRRGGLGFECVTGDPVGAIVRSVQGHPDHVVCMATRGRGRLTAPLLGSVATAVLRDIDGPMVLVGPACETAWWHDPAHLVACWAGPSSDAVLDPATDWSTELGMDLALLCVFHPLDVSASVEPRRQFAPALRRLEARHVEARTIDLHDEDAAVAIAVCARDLPASLLALTTHARSGLGRAVLGSVAMDVVRRSPCPVLVVRHPH